VREDEMRRKLIWMPLLSTIAMATVANVGRVEATPAAGFTGTTIALGRFDDINALNHQILPDAQGRRLLKNLWVSLQKTKGASDLYVQNNTWAAGGTTGWHTHPGHSLIIVTAGTVTAYEGDDPTCTPHVYTQGMGLVDEGGDHVHVLRNEGSVEARTIAVQLIPAGATRRVDAPANPACPF
jgi:quercetin dioxygenase-like cupin family protein